MENSNLTLLILLFIRTLRNSSSSFSSERTLQPVKLLHTITPVSVRHLHKLRWLLPLIIWLLLHFLPSGIPLLWEPVFIIVIRSWITLNLSTRTLLSLVWILLVCFVFTDFTFMFDWRYSARFRCFDDFLHSLFFSCHGWLFIDNWRHRRNITIFFTFIWWFLAGFLCSSFKLLN